jgi:hypothetical protein
MPSWNERTLMYRSKLLGCSCKSSSRLSDVACVPNCEQFCALGQNDACVAKGARPCSTIHAKVAFPRPSVCVTKCAVPTEENVRTVAQSLTSGALPATYRITGVTICRLRRQKARFGHIQRGVCSQKTTLNPQRRHVRAKSLLHLLLRRSAGVPHCRTTSIPSKGKSRCRVNRIVSSPRA